MIIYKPKPRSMISVHANMVSTSFSLFTIFIVSLSKSVFTSARTTGNQLTGFSSDIIHRDSVNSPLFNPSLSHHDRFRASVHRSHTRFNILRRAILSKGKTSRASFQFGLASSNFEYLMTIQVGTPSKSIVAIIDTGSDVVWTNCRSYCKSYKQDAWVFYPMNSSTFHELKCNSDSCHLLDSPERNCSKQIDSCRYKLWYGDGSFVYGLLASETFAFNTSDGRHVKVLEVTFGCSDMSNGTFDDSHTTGVIGLGGGHLSLVSQLGPLFGYKFSYCFAPYTTNGASGKLNFGSNALFSEPHVQSTPLIKTPLLPSTFFVVQLSGITVGDMELEPHGSNIVLDSGTTLTYLDRKLVQPILERVKNMIHLQIVKDPNFDLCFKTDLINSKVEYPDIILTLGTVKIKLEPEKAFVNWEDDKRCLNIVTSPTGFQILGNLAQQDLHVGYDLQQQRVYFESTDCTRL